MTAADDAESDDAVVYAAERLIVPSIFDRPGKLPDVHELQKAERLVQVNRVRCSFAQCVLLLWPAKRRCRWAARWTDRFVLGLCVPAQQSMLITVFHAFNSGGILAAERVCSPSAWKRLCEPYIVHTRYVASSYVHELAPIDPGCNPRGAATMYTPQRWGTLSRGER